MSILHLCNTTKSQFTKWITKDQLGFLLCVFDVLQRNFRRTFREIESSYPSSSSRPAYNRLKLKMMFEEIVRQTFGIWHITLSENGASPVKISKSKLWHPLMHLIIANVVCREICRWSRSGWLRPQLKLKDGLNFNILNFSLMHKLTDFSRYYT